MNKSDTIEIFRVRDGPDRHKDRGKDSGEDRGSDSRDRNDRNDRNERDSKNDCQRSRDRARDSDRDRDSNRQYTLTQRTSKQFNIELNKQVIAPSREQVGLLLMVADILCSRQNPLS